MKETSRLAPGSMLVYSRCVEEPIVLSMGLHLKPGQFITTSGHKIAMDPDISRTHAPTMRFVLMKMGFLSTMPNRSAALRAKTTDGVPAGGPARGASLPVWSARSS